jgi:protein gp37
MNKTSIQWCDYSSNPIKARRLSDGKQGHACTHVSSGCTNCYSETINRRFGTALDYSKQNESKIEFYLDEKELARWSKIPAGKKVFVCDMTDIFHAKISHAFIMRVLLRIHATPDVTFQVLTKRAERMSRFLSSPLTQACFPSWPLKNLWLGVSCEDQETADERIPLLIQTPAATKFISYEPALSAVDFGKYLAEISLLIIGGESGKSARPCDVQWIESAIRQCKDAGTKVFVKQCGSNFGFMNVGVFDRVKLNDSKGGNIEGWPPNLRVRQFPDLTMHATKNYNCNHEN